MIRRRDVTFVTIALQFVVRASQRVRRSVADSSDGDRMNKIEYKTILLPYKTGMFQE